MFYFLPKPSTSHSSLNVKTRDILKLTLEGQVSRREEGRCLCLGNSTRDVTSASVHESSVLSLSQYTRT